MSSEEMVVLIERFMDKRGISSEDEMARLIGVAQSTVNRWLGRKHKVGRQFWPRIREVCAEVAAVAPPEAAYGISNSEELREVLLNRMLDRGRRLEDLCKDVGIQNAGVMRELLLVGSRPWDPELLAAVGTVLELRAAEMPLSCSDRGKLEVAGRIGTCAPAGVAVVEMGELSALPMADGRPVFPSAMTAGPREPLPVDVRRGGVVRFAGDSDMVPELRAGDRLVVDCETPAASRGLVVAMVGERPLVRWLVREGERVYLRPDTWAGNSFEVVGSRAVRLSQDGAGEPVEEGPLAWILPVVEVRRAPRK